MTIASSALSATVGLQGVALAGRAYETIPPAWRGVRPRRSRPARRARRPRRERRLLCGFTDIMIGTALLRPTAQIAQKIS